MSNENELYKLLLEKLERVEQKVINSAAMNGGFDKLANDVGHIKDTQKEVLDAVKGVKKSLYEPDSGLFSRVRELETESDRRKEFIIESKPALEFSKELVVWKRHADKELEQFEKMQIEFAKLQDWKAGAQRVIWLVATAAGGMWVKHFMDLMMK
jgi:hypothetical protein